MEQDPFELWDIEFNDIELPKDPIDTVVEESFDPIDCARALHQFINGHRDDERPHMTRRGLNKLRYKYYGAYKDSKSLEVLINGGYAVPEPSESQRTRNVTTPIALPGHRFIRGRLSSIVEQEYRQHDSGDTQSMITLHMRDPVILDEFSNPRTEYELPDYVVTPIASVIRYAFLPDDFAVDS